MKILTIDDSMMVRNSIKRILKDIGYSDVIYLSAENGKIGLEIFEKEQPDILILDLLMPNMDGTEVAQKLQTIDHHCFISVLSSNFQKPVKERLLNMGVHLFIEKPITKEKIELIMNSYKMRKKDNI